MRDDVKFFIVEFTTVDGVTAGAVLVLVVAGLEHEGGDYSVDFCFGVGGLGEGAEVGAGKGEVSIAEGEGQGAND